MASRIMAACKRMEEVMELLYRLDLVGMEVHTQVRRLCPK